MDIQELITLVTEKIDEVSTIESNAEDKLTTLEDIRDRANDVGSSLQHYVDSLNDLDQTLNESYVLVEDAEREELTY